ncbi:hypothetical protein QMK19_36365 [Streptomyces sp. H10-C2]|uniref:hypothetical protein n=1 Tax=unclassified Streptomyces TaxID=2593676 RepID=UPI0022AFECD2|nr:MULTISPECIES: hypothetical protein [unclassified Streptomyces]MCZ4102667.1 hypothetical protein [Streptomyces sp. H39-C1]MDJ0346362.1 hypothetical protein [Streptomyces sp. PH10-H1]MDJ0374948.1 hypothetical protein [Streptomyces sp. H10-C2]
MNTIFAGIPARSQRTGLVQVETLARLSSLTGVRAVEWLECPVETVAQRQARLEFLADVLLGLDEGDEEGKAAARLVAALYREVLEEPAVIETADPVFGPVRHLQVLPPISAPAPEFAAVAA